MTGIKAINAVLNEYGNWDYEWEEISPENCAQIDWKGAQLVFNPVDSD